MYLRKMARKKYSPETSGLQDILPRSRQSYGPEMSMEKKQSEVVMDSIVQQAYGNHLWNMRIKISQNSTGKSQNESTNIL
jgi:hypothetical protein